MAEGKGMNNPHRRALRDFALGYPGAHEDFPWGELVLKVQGKVFVFLGTDSDEVGLSIKLPQSNAAALMMPFATPTGYGLGKSGWVSVRFGPKEKPPLALLRQWIDESYRAVAPKKLVAGLEGKGPEKPTAVKKASAAKKSAAAKKPAARKTAKKAVKKTAKRAR
ncbi:MmcQ/YjbR family DNA-binding protein [Stigmatella erecta]|uniref:Predicted DNA-binding protein, MmcQ/YjbR family n=1 Tax=Stigmatella erecta TaxID=83460 RepID=A0A1H9YUA8_9BACT|nr:MmcQ/YjbR family DNA-binding protein [Stigmatella erecta]SES72661.1 Predicted DNA-binding protein, MmcQ/YjbR family [Stigmatella erecta]